MSNTHCVEPAEYIEEDLLIKSGAEQLICTLCKPSTEITPTDCAVITLHGWGGTRCGPHRMFTRLCRTLAVKGIYSLRFDLPGRGYSTGEAITLDGMIQATMNVSDFLRQRFNINDIRLCGICSGGNVAIGAATFTTVSRIATVSTFPFAQPTASSNCGQLQQRLKQYFHKACSLQTWKRLLRGEVNIKGVGKVLQDSVSEDKSQRNLKDSSHDIMAGFTGYPGKILFTYGEADPQAKQAREHYKDFCKAHRIDATFDTIDGANHNFMACHLADQLLEKLASFLSA